MNEHKPHDPRWVEVINELEHTIQHGLNLLTIALVTARETLFGDDKEDDK